MFANSVLQKPDIVITPWYYYQSNSVNNMGSFTNSFHFRKAAEWKKQCAIQCRDQFKIREMYNVGTLCAAHILINSN